MIKHHDQDRAYLECMVQKVRVRGGGEVSGRQHVAGAAAKSSHLGPTSWKTESTLEMTKLF